MESEKNKLSHIKIGSILWVKWWRISHEAGQYDQWQTPEVHFLLSPSVGRVSVQLHPNDTHFCLHLGTEKKCSSIAQT